MQKDNILMSIRHNQQDKEKLGAQLKTIRQERNMSQEELARLLEVSVFCISRWESAKHFPNQSMLKLMKMLKVLP